MSAGGCVYAARVCGRVLVCAGSVCVRVCASNRPRLPHPPLTCWRTTQFFFKNDDSFSDFDETFNLSEPLTSQ